MPSNNLVIFLKDGNFTGSICNLYFTPSSAANFIFTLPEDYLRCHVKNSNVSAISIYLDSSFINSIDKNQLEKLFEVLSNFGDSKCPT